MTRNLFPIALILALDALPKSEADWQRDEDRRRQLNKSLEEEYSYFAEPFRQERAAKKAAQFEKQRKQRKP